MKKSLFVLFALLAIVAGVNAQDMIQANGAEPATLDPALMQDTASNNIYLALFEGLVQYDPKTSKGIPAMASSWTTSADGLTVTFKLRDAKWSDGTPVTAQDFVYGWLRTLKTRNRFFLRVYAGHGGQGRRRLQLGQGQSRGRGDQGSGCQDLPGFSSSAPLPLLRRHDGALRLRSRPEMGDREIRRPVDQAGQPRQQRRVQPQRVEGPGTISMS